MPEFDRKTRPARSARPTGATTAAASLKTSDKSGEALSASLIAAAQEGNASEIQRLLALGANPDAADPRSGATALSEAIRHSHLAAFEALLPVSDLSARVGRDRQPLLSIAAQAGRSESFEMARRLLPLSNPNAVDSVGDTPLHQAIRGGIEGMVQLLAPKTKLSALNFDDQTPMGLALARRYRPTLSHFDDSNPQFWRVVCLLFPLAPERDRNKALEECPIPDVLRRADAEHEAQALACAIAQPQDQAGQANKGAMQTGGASLSTVRHPRRAL